MTSKGQQIHYAERMIEGTEGVHKDEIDYKSLIDESLEWNENKEKIEERINSLKPEAEEKTKQQVEAEVEKLERQADKHLQSYKNEEMEELIQKHSPSDDADYDLYYEGMWRYIDLVAEGYRDLLILISKAGLGKSYQTVHRLRNKGKKKGEDFVTKSGFTTPLELYKTIADNPDKVIVLDDLEGVLSNKRSIAILKQATWDAEKGDARMVEWDSNTDKLEDTDTSVEFTGQIIMCVNELPDNDRFKPVRSRAVKYQLEFDHQEVADLLIEIAKDLQHKNLEKQARVDTAKWIAGNSSEDSNLDIRTLEKVLDFRDFSEDEWKEMARPVMNLEEEIGFIKKQFKRGIDKSEIKHNYIEEFNRSESDFYNKWKKAGLP